MQKALITGATSGIGKELAFVMAEAGHDLVLVARGKEKLNELNKEITKMFGVNVSVYSYDLSLPGSALSLHKATKKENIEILVNNAGVGLRGNFFDDDFTRTLRMTQLNMLSLMELTHLYGQDFIRKDSGKILNIASITAFLPGPKQPVYYATKSFVRSLSRALAHNLRNTGVSVTLLHPGVTKTNFFKSSRASSFTGGASAKSVAITGYNALMAGKIEVTHGVKNKFLTNVFVRLIPYRYHAPIVDRASDV